MTSTIIILLCVGPLVAMCYDYEAPNPFRQTVASRSEQCQRRFPISLGECLISHGKDFTTYLEHFSCGKLWCIIKVGDRNMCIHVGRPDEYTPCGDSKYCSEGKCIGK